MGGPGRRSVPTLNLPDAVKWLPAVLVAALLWGLLRRAATPDPPAAVLGALHQATPAQLTSITVYPLLPGRRGEAPRPFQLRGPAAVRPLLPGLRQLRILAVDTATFRPLLEATVVIRLTADLADAWHLRGRDVVLRLAATPTQQVALRAQSRVVYASPTLSRRVQQVRDSLAAGKTR